MGNSASQSLVLPYKPLSSDAEAIKLLRESVYDPPSNKRESGENDDTNSNNNS